MNDAIHVRLQLHYPDFSLDVDLDLPGRGVTALYGHSGSGKTTCLRCIAGLERAEQGFVQINDEVWQDSHHKRFLPPHKRALGYVFQEASLFPHLSVLANLEFGWRRIPRAQRRVDMPMPRSYWGSATCSIAIRNTSPAVSANASASPGRCSPARGCC